MGLRALLKAGLGGIVAVAGLGLEPPAMSQGPSHVPQPCTRLQAARPMLAVLDPGPALLTRKVHRRIRLESILYAQ